VLDKAENRLKEWQNLRIKDLTGNEILRKFDELQEPEQQQNRLLGGPMLL
jgi:hypothetical protein